jgi:hypothetical protein
VKFIPVDYFSQFDNLEIMNKFSEIEKLGSQCFGNCGNIKEVMLPSRLKKIED